jgi:hypothetical protein
MARAVKRVTIDDLLAEREITRVLVTYCRGSDRCDAESMSGVYHEDAWEDHGGSFRGTARDYVAWVIPYVRENFLATQHTLHNILIDLDGDQARVESHCIAHHVRRSSSGGELVMDVFGCRYLDRFERRDRVGWRIAHRVVVREWQLRQPMLSPADQAPGYLAGRRDRSDLAFLTELPRREPTPAGSR